MPICTIIIPCYNEQATIDSLLEKVAAQDLSELGVEKEILVVDDGSQDGSLAAIERFQASHPDAGVQVLSHEPNRGKGHAIRAALERARGEIVLVQDADLEYDPGDYKTLLKPVVRGVSDVVFGSRWLNKENRISGGLYALGGGLWNLYLHLLYRTNITDIATGYKIFRTDVLKSLALECVQFEFCPEVTAKLLNRRIGVLEIPIRYRPRKKREGKKICWKDFWIGLYTITRVRWKRL